MKTVRIAGALALAWLVSSGATEAQTIKGSDMTTQNAVADYNAGNFSAARAEFLRAAKKGGRLAEFNYSMMLLNGEGGPATGKADPRLILSSSAVRSPSIRLYSFLT